MLILYLFNGLCRVGMYSCVTVNTKQIETLVKITGFWDFINKISNIAFFLSWSTLLLKNVILFTVGVVACTDHIHVPVSVIMHLKSTMINLYVS